MPAKKTKEDPAKTVTDISLALHCLIGALSRQPGFNHANFAAEAKKYIDVLQAEPNPNLVAADIVRGAADHVDLIRLMNG